MDFLREALTAIARQIMDVEVQRKTGAARGERSSERLVHRNGYRERRWDTRAGSILPPVPKLREGSYFPSFLEPRRRSEEALIAVICEAYVKGVSTRKVEDLMQASGIQGISKSEVSRICAEFDSRVKGLPGPAPSRALPLPVAGREIREGAGRGGPGGLHGPRRRLRGLGRPESDRRAGGARPGGLRERGPRLLEAVPGGSAGPGPRRAKHVCSDAHRGLTRAISEVFLGASWQRCRVHFLRNLLALVPKDAQGMVLAATRLIFQQPDKERACLELRALADRLEERLPRAAALLLEAEEEILAHVDFPREHSDQDRLHQPLGASEQGDRAQDPGGGHLGHLSLRARVSSASPARSSPSRVMSGPSSRRYMSQGSLAALYVEEAEQEGRVITHPVLVPVH